MNEAKNYPLFGSDAHKDLAYKSACESITLLKNENQILPLSRNQKLLVAGPTANNLIYLNGAWTHTWQGYDSTYNTNDGLTIYEALKKEVGEKNCLYAQGAELYFENGFETSKLVNVDDFKLKVQVSDIVVLCLP